MDIKLLLPLFLIAGVIGWFFPTGETASKPAQAPSNSLDSYNSNPDPVILDRREDGHFYATADVSGKPVLFLVDTGASIIALTGKDARALGLSWDERELKVVGRGVSGDVYGTDITLDKVAVGDVEFRNLRASIIPEGLDISLLGQNFLGRAKTVSINGDRMTIGG
jgi:aspartyl protease family protein